MSRELALQEDKKKPRVAANALFHALDDLCDFAESYGWAAVGTQDGIGYQEAVQLALRAAAPVLGIGNLQTLIDEKFEQEGDGARRRS